MFMKQYVNLVNQYVSKYLLSKATEELHQQEGRGQTLRDETKTDDHYERVENVHYTLNTYFSILNKTTAFIQLTCLAQYNSDTF